MKKAILSVILVLSIFLFFSCERLKPKNELKIRDVKVRLSEYFTIKWEWSGWWLDIPTEIQLPDKTIVEGSSMVHCMDRKYVIYCDDPRCIPYTIKKGRIDDGKFDMKSVWYQICKSAATSNRPLN